jgi:ribonuclease R
VIEFETTETRIIFGENKKIDRILPVERNEAHKIIEEFMIAANVATAKYLEENEIPSLYRVHNGPTEQKLADLRAFLAEAGLKLGGGSKPESKHYAVLLNSLRDRPDFSMYQTVLLRSLSQAVYCPDNAGHFGLAFDAYTHFTSPIRRYPDLLVHRGIKHLVEKKKAKSFRYSHENMENFGDSCSMTERRADDATRDALDWLKTEFMLDKVGQEFTGKVTGVTGFGLFILLDDAYVEGLVHITALDNDYYHFDSAKHRLVGERSKKIYQLADEIRIRVARVDLDEKKIDFELADSAPGTSSARVSRKKSSKGRKSEKEKSRKSLSGKAKSDKSKSQKSADKAGARTGSKKPGTKKPNTKKNRAKKTQVKKVKK